MVVSRRGAHRAGDSSASTPGGTPRPGSVVNRNRLLRSDFRHSLPPPV